MATIRPFQVNNGLEVNLNANVANALSASDFIQNNPERPYAPTVVFDFAKTERLDPRVTFTRASNATYTAANNLIATVGTNTPRFQYENGVCQGLFVELQRTNLYKYSTDIFTGVTNVRVPGSYIFYDGSVGIRQVGLGTVANIDYAQSIYIKINSQSNQTFGINVGDGVGITYNANALSVGVWTRLTNIARQGVSGDFFDLRINGPKLGLTASNQWGDPSTSGIATQNYGIAPNGNRESTRIFWTCTDNTLFDIELWGFQVETGAGGGASYITSFIPTGASSATRIHDQAFVNNANNVLSLNSSQGAFLFVGKTYKNYNANTPSFDQGTAALVLQNSDYGTQNNYFNIVTLSEVTNTLYCGHTGITPNGTFVGTSISAGANFLYPNNEVRAIGNYIYTDAVKQYNVAATSNGVFVASSNQNFLTDLALPIFPNRYLIFGQNYAPNNRMWNGPIKKVAYYNRALSNNEVLSLTTI